MTDINFQGAKGQTLSTVTTALQQCIDSVIFSLRLSDPARKYLQQVISNGPSRKVSGQTGNVCFNFHSKKMGTRVMLESRRGEHVHAILLENDPTVIAYFAQPPSVDLEIKRENGLSSTRTSYTADMLIVREHEIVIAETRDESRLIRALEKNPYQFYKDEQHRWRYRAAEELFNQLGFRYELLANSSLPGILVENVRFLEDYCQSDSPPVAEHVAAAIAERLRTLRKMPLGALLDVGFSADAIFKSIADGHVYVDLMTDRLACTQDLILYSDVHTSRVDKALKASQCEPQLPIPGTYLLKPNSRVKYNGKTYIVVLCGERDVLLADEHGAQSTLDLQVILNGHKNGLIELDQCVSGTRDISIADVSPAELKRAQAKLDAVRSGNSGDFSERSLWRYRAAIAHAGNDLEALLALVDRQRDRGNTNSRISDANKALIEKAIAQHYNDERNTNKKGAWDKYVGLCEQAIEDNGQPLKHVTYATFCRHANALASTKSRKGKRADYQESAIQQALECVFPAHGVRPHEICYVDHTIANIALISPSGNALGKPTLSLGADGHTAQSRAFYLSFDPPSTRVVLMVLRDYVRRHSRLPRVLSVDNGSDFRSAGLSEFCKLYGIELRFRAPGQPRGGSMIERLLGATEDEVLSELKGNTRILRSDARLVTKSVDPFRFAAWTLPALYELLEHYLFTERPNRPHPALGVTPNEFEARRLRETGLREFKGVRFDENIMLLTCPHASRRNHNVDPQRGVWVDGLWYQHPELRLLRKGTKVEVRVEPWNAKVIYVQVPKGWVAAIGNDSRWLYRNTRREMELALRTERRNANRDAAKAKVNPALRTHRHHAWEPADFDSRLAITQEEMRYLYDQKKMTLAMPQQIPKDVEVINPALDTPTSPDSLATATGMPELHAPQQVQQEVAWPAVDDMMDLPVIQESMAKNIVASTDDVDVFEVADQPSSPGNSARAPSLLKKIGRFR